MKRAIRWLVLLALAGAAIGWTLFSLRHEKPLLAQATRFPLRNWEGWDYAWLSDHEMLVHRWAGVPKTPYRAWFRVDTRTGVETPLIGLTKVFKRYDTPPGGHHVSPDGKWLFVKTLSPDVFAVQLDGTGFLRWQMTRDWAPAVWMRDSRSVVCIDPGHSDEGVTALIQSVYAPRSAKQVRFVAADAVVEELRQFTDVQCLSENHVLVRQATEPGRVVSSLDIYEMGLGAKSPPARKYAIKLPCAARIEETRFSPQGDRIAWLMKTDRVPPLPALLHRLLPIFKARSVSAATLWVSRLDGSAMREIGYLEDGGKKGPDIYNLAWHPDGKRLSFAYREALYIVSVEMM